MSQSRFAHITASLLARKGEAKPWEDPGKKSLSWRDDPLPPASISAAPAAPAVPAAPPFVQVQASAVQESPRQCHDLEFSDMSAPEPARAYDPEKIKKCTIRMSFIDYERLGIIAVKKNVTRQHLLHDALERCFQLAAEEYRKECACVGNREACCQT